MPFGQLVVGPPGSGKSTYCDGMQQFYRATGRPVAVVNLDPANDNFSYDCDVDICELVSLEGVQSELGLGPNGGLLYAIDYLAANLDWLEERLAPLEKEGRYFLFDCPGQVELFSLAGSLQTVLDRLTRQRAYRLAVVQLVDAHLCSDPAKYLSALCLCLTTMLHLELPQVNVLSKFDLVEQYGELQLGVDFYLQAQGLEHLADAMASAVPPRFLQFTRELCEVVEDFGLLQFVPLAIEDKQAVAALAALVDKANGFVWAGLARPDGMPAELQYVAGEGGRAAVWERMAEQYMAGRQLEVLERQESAAMPDAQGEAAAAPAAAGAAEGDGAERASPAEQARPMDSG